MEAPVISVVVPSHARRLRLWWLLNALEDQDLDPRAFEILVVHDYTGDVAEILGRHPLTRSGRARTISIEPGTGSPARQRNIGWRAAKAPLVAFTDDDCRPDRGWLRALLAGFEGAAHDTIVQGATSPDPLETAIFAAPHHRSLQVDPPNLFAQTCNIAYPRALLEALNGFDEVLVAGEDTDLAVRAKKRGARQVGRPEARVFHAVEEFSLPQTLRSNLRWQHLPGVLRKHPELRHTLTLGVFWRPAHAELVLALLGVAASRRSPAALALILPYVRRSLDRRRGSRRARLAAAVELPGKAVVDAAEVVTLIRGSLRHRTLML